MDWIDSLLPWIDNVLHEETDVDSIDPLPWRTDFSNNLTIVQHVQLHAELSVGIRTTKLPVASLLPPPLASTSSSAADGAFSDSLEMRHTGNWCV